MEKIKRTFKELIQVDFLVGSLYAKDPELKETKLGYAYNRFYEKNIKPTKDEMENKGKELYIDHALEDEKTKAIIRDPQSPTGFAHSKQQMKDMRQKEQEIIKEMEDKEIEIQPYISSYIPADLTEDQTEQLKGLLI